MTKDPGFGVSAFMESARYQHALETELARGYEDAIAGDLNEWWLWIPLCMLFVAPFIDPRIKLT